MVVTVVGVSVGLGSSGSVGEGEMLGSKIGSGVIVGSTRAGGVLEPYPSSPEYRVPALEHPHTHFSIRVTHA